MTAKKRQNGTKQNQTNRKRRKNHENFFGSRTAEPKQKASLLHSRTKAEK